MVLKVSATDGVKVGWGAMDDWAAARNKASNVIEKAYTVVIIVSMHEHVIINHITCSRCIASPVARRSRNGSLRRKSVA